MKATYIDYSETNSFSPAVISYLEGNENLKPFISHLPNTEGFRNLLADKKELADRRILTNVLKKQYATLLNKELESLPHAFSGNETNFLNHEDFAQNNLVVKNISLLEHTNTYTVTTGHQLNIFTGPLYFIFKIATAIKLARDLKQQFPDKNFVPVYWMATEDHDFAEINHTYIGGKKISWEKDAAGATGRIKTDDILNALKEYTGILGISENAMHLAGLIERAYTHPNLSDATRFLVNSLFGEYGLLIIDADQPEFKKQFSEYIEKDILQQNSFNNINTQTEELQKIGFETQVNPREINFFYLRDKLRERIVFEKSRYVILNTDISFSEEEIKEEIKAHPEYFSPNVVMRPLYQEVILPNIAYIGGGAEIVYWLQLKQNFDYYQVEFPILVLRNSALITDYSTTSRISKLDLKVTDIFKATDDLEKNWVLNHSKNNLNLQDEWQELKCIFEKIKLRAHKIDVTLSPSTEAVQVRLHKAIVNLEKKLIKAEKRNYSESLNQIKNIKTKLFPHGGLQERSENFGLLYVKYGEDLIKSLINNFNPLDFRFTILQEENPAH
ncbi:bacillithiol biosynthesis cysteine-adding enzyme BshC [Daejeonella oryzae]|uniref:bacillithiol biosynthesis cysteine-adding enzyme BshC n=1 Tax=Daejeonella oryzae TaxID=1122943 RepID=UPI0004177E5A|nr:bacillithiol biosynthesis cysteine-adding enzyme BshC [Daejeonella oryzae]